jgi:hypothetical protein
VADSAAEDSASEPSAAGALEEAGASDDSVLSAGALEDAVPEAGGRAIGKGAS